MLFGHAFAQFNSVNYYCNPNNVDAEWLVYDLKTKTIIQDISKIVDHNPTMEKNRVLDYLYNNSDLALWQALRYCLESYGLNPEVVSESSPLMIEYLNLKASENPEHFVIPKWMRNNAEGWVSGTIGDYTFTQTILFLSKTDAWNTSPIQYVEGFSPEIPNWFKQVVSWWNGHLFTDEEFINGIQYLTEKGIIRV